jgi:type VI secretion system protein ImpA
MEQGNVSPHHSENLESLFVELISRCSAANAIRKKQSDGFNTSEFTMIHLFDNTPPTDALRQDLSLVDPAEDAAPCGEELTYDQEFIDLERLAAGKTEQQFGLTIIPAESPDWHQVALRAVSLLKRTKDLRVATLLTRAWVELDGLAGYRRGVVLVAELLERYWTELHPRIETDGESDPLMRINALRNLGDAESLGRGVRNAILLQGKQGSLTTRDAAAILDGHASQAAASLNLDVHELCQQLSLAANVPQSPTACIPEILAALGMIAHKVRSELGDAWVPDFRSIEAPLRLIVNATQPLRGKAGPSPAPLDGEIASSSRPSASEPPVDGEASPLQNMAGQVLRSRSEVVDVLLRACVYMELHEPSHPAPLLIRRAIRLIGMSFYDIVRDMVPAGIPQLDLLANLRQAGEPAVKQG